MTPADEIAALRLDVERITRERNEARADLERLRQGISDAEIVLMAGGRPEHLRDHVVGRLRALLEDVAVAPRAPESGA